VYIEPLGVLADGVTCPFAEFTEMPGVELYAPVAPTRLDVAMLCGVVIELQKPAAA